MKNKIVVLLIALGCFNMLFAQNSNRKFISFKESNGIVTIEVSDGSYQIKAYSNQIIETSFIPKGESYNPISHAVVLQPEFSVFKIVNFKDSVHFATDGIGIKVSKSPFQIHYYYNGNLLTSEKTGYHKNEKYEVLDFNLTNNEILMGGGARALGMNRRGHKLPLYNRAHYGYETYSELMNYTIPLVYSSNRYAIHFDNAPIGNLDLDSEKNNTLSYETISGRKTYQVIAGDNWEELIGNYSKLTGFQPLLPRWALGNFSSRFGYHSQNEVLSTIQKFENEKIPVDAIILDLYWFGKDIKGTMGNLEFDKDSFPDPKKMISDLKSKGVKTILITEPFILTTSNRWNEAVLKDVLGKNKFGEPYKYDFYFGNTGIIDIFKPEGEQWFWDIYKKFTNYGVAGWWGDLGEPEVHPSDLVHHTGTADEVHNIYGHKWAQLVFEGYKNDFPNQRPFILMRAGYSGSQRFGLVPWSGDVNRSWGGLQSQVEIALQMGMQGLGFMHSDLGGFAGANLDDELYTRWLQYGVFQPIYRPHAQEEVPSEPVFREEKTKGLAKKSIELRYKLLPYNYTLAFENNQFGKPLMKPLFFTNSENLELYSNTQTYLWGNDFLISPITKSKLKEQLVTFPKESNWYNFYTDEKISGGQSVNVKLTNESIPTYVRGGAFIPMSKPILNTVNYSLTNFELHFYFDEQKATSSSYLYNDNGLTPNAFEKGEFEKITFKSFIKKRNLKIEIEPFFGDNMQVSTKKIDLVIHNIASKPIKINANSYTYLAETKTLLIPVSVSNKKKTLKIKI